MRFGSVRSSAFNNSGEAFKMSPFLPGYFSTMQPRELHRPEWEPELIAERIRRYLQRPVPTAHQREPRLPECQSNENLRSRLPKKLPAPPANNARDVDPV